MTYLNQNSDPIDIKAVASNLAGISDFQMVKRFVRGSISMPPRLRNEVRAAGEFWHLLGSDVYKGIGVPRGNGEPILITPGFMAPDKSLDILKNWLIEMHYNAHTPGMISNFEYTGPSLDKMRRKVEELAAASGLPVTLIGHSRGGMQSKIFADLYPDLVSQTITLGSPLNAEIGVNPAYTPLIIPIYLANAVLHGVGEAMEELPYMKLLLQTPKRLLTSIASESDGIVAYKACLRGDVDHIKVHGSHLGYIVNEEVYRHLAALLHRGPAKAKAAA